MTKDPICISPDTTLAQAREIMNRNNFHRLPVVDAQKHLIGLVTGGLIEDSTNENHTSLDVYELKYLLSRTKVSEIMITDVKTISPDAMIDEAADKMRQYGIAVLPVVDEENKVLGIITEMDLFSSLIQLMGLRIDGTHFLISVQDVPGVMADIARLFADNAINIDSFLVYRGPRGTELYCVTMSHCPEMAEKIEAMGRGFKVRVIRK
jgi:acetoin utilization protein AcuB